MKGLQIGLRFSMPGKQTMFKSILSFGCSNIQTLTKQFSYSIRILTSERACQAKLGRIQHGCPLCGFVSLWSQQFFLVTLCFHMVSKFGKQVIVLIYLVHSTFCLCPHMCLSVASHCILGIWNIDKYWSFSGMWHADPTKMAHIQQRQQTKRHIYIYIYVFCHSGWRAAVSRDCGALVWSDGRQHEKSFWMSFYFFCVSRVYQRKTLYSL